MAQESILRIVIDSRNAERNAQALDRELRSIERNGDFASRSMDGFSVACRQLAGYMMGVVTAGAAISKMDDYTNLNNRLRLVTNSQQELNKAMKDTFDIAQRSGAAWGGTAAIYQKIQYNSEKLGLSQAKVAQITESISKSISNSGSSAQAAGAALYQLGQAFDKSSLNGDEFVSMSENAGYLMEVFAKGLGVTRAELKEMSSAGELTTDKMVQAIQNMSDSIEEDFGKTNFTIGQSITQFSNAATQFIGGAGESSGAATMLSSSIKTLADNMNLIANVAVLGGITMLTKAILTQTVAVHAAITSSIARRASMLGELQAAAQVAAAEVSRTGAIAQLRAMQLADAQATAARLTGMQRLAYVQGTLLPLERASAAATATHTAALNADTLAQNANNAARSRATRIFNAVGGTVGVLTIGVAALAAGYMYMQKRADEANKKLEEQAEVAKKAKEELLALKGLEKDDAIDKMTASFKRQNEALEQSSSTINMQLNAIEQLYKGNKEVTQVVKDARNGTISMNEAVQRFNEIRIDKEVYNSFKKNAEIFSKNAEEAANSKDKMRLFGIEVELTGRKAQTAKFGIQESTDALGKNATAAEKAAKAQESFRASLFDREFEARLSKNLLAKGYSPEQVKNMVDTANWARKNNVQITNDLYQTGLQVLSLEEQNNKVIEQGNNAQKERTRELKEQGKALLVNAKVQANATKYDFAAIEKKYGLPNGMLSGIHMQESRGNGNAIGPKTKYGRAKGGFQFLDGTAERFGLKGNDVFNIGKAADAAGQYLQYLYKKFGDWDKAISAYHAGEGNVQKGTNIGPVNRQYVKNIKGYMAGSSGLSFGTDYTVEDYLSDLEKADEAYKKFQKDQDALRQQFSSEDVIRNQKRIDDIAEAERLGLQHLIPKIEEYYKAQGQLAHLHYIEEVNGYKWSEEQKIAHTRLVDQQQLILSTQYTDAEKKIVNKAIDDRAAYELAVFNEAQRRKAQELSDVLTEQQKQSSRNQLRFIAQATINPSEYARWSLQNNMTNDVGYAFEDYEKNVNNINRKDEAGRFEIEDANVRNQLLQQAERTHQAKMLEIKEEYALQAKDLDQQEYETKMQVYGQIAGMVSQTFDQMAGMLKESAGESNALYKSMFLTGKAASIAQAIVNTEEGATKALAQGGVYGSLLAGVVKATGYASVGIMAGQTIAGFATGGHITGKGTGTSDDIPIMASNGEFMMRYAAVQKLGLPAMEYINKTGELPFQREYEELHKRIAGNQLPEPFIVPKYKDGGLVGVSSTQSTLQRDTNRLSHGVLNAIGTSKAVVAKAEIIINNNASVDVSARQGDDGKVYVTIDEVRKEAEDAAKRSWDRLGNANSHESQQLSRNINSNRRR